MPTLLQINSFNIGSTGKIAEQIGSLAIKQGWNSYFAFPRGFNKSNSEIIRIGGRMNMFWHGFESRIFDNQGLASRLATKKIVNQIVKISPDIIHLHNLHGYYLNYKILFEFLKEYNHPIVWTLHDCWPMTGHCCYFTMANCSKWKTQCTNCPLKKDYPKSFLFDRSKQNYIDKKNAFTGIKNIHIVSVSNWLNEIVKDSFLGYANLHTIRNGIDIETFKPQISNNLRLKNSINNKIILLGVASRWEPRKGFNDYIELRKLLNDDYIIVLIGLDDKIIKSLPKGIIGIKRTENQQQLAQWYSEANIVLNLSYQETFGLTTIEGFACGTPSIVYNTTASPELISEDTGVIVKPGDINQLYAAIKKITINPLKSEDCRKRAVDLYDKDIAFREYLNLYNMILASKR